MNRPVAQERPPLPPVKQALVAAGGFGTRMSESLNPARCKPLMEYAGQTMLGWLIDGLLAGGIDNVVVASGYHSDGSIRNILEQKQVPHTAAKLASKGFRTIPFEVQDILEDRFLFVCGHQPVPGSHVRGLREAAETHTHAITAYQSKKYPLAKEKRIVVDEEGGNRPSFRYVASGTSSLDPQHLYIRNPYIVSKEVIEQTKQDDFSYTFSYYLLKHWKEGGSLAVVEASMPPEYDTDEEYLLNARFIGDTLVNQASSMPAAA